MRVSYEWLKTHRGSASRTQQTLSSELVRTGTEVEASRACQALTLDHVVTAQVVSKEPHPDSDHMWRCPG